MPGPYLNQGAFRTKVTDTTTVGAEEELGIWRYEAGKVLRYVKAGALIPGRESCKLDTTVTTAGLMGMQVLQVSNPTDMFVGVAEVTLPSLGFGWITAYGPATARVVGGAGAANPGVGLAPGVLTGVLSLAVTCNFNACAIALQSGLSAGSAVFISVL